MSEEPSYSPRDIAYLNSPSFECYMVAGFVFVATFTAAFIFSVMSHQQVLAWPGLVVAGVLCFITLKILQRREYLAKKRELEAEAKARLV